MSTIYPWYEIINEDDDLQQGDLFDDCPVYVPTFDAIKHGIVDFEWEERDLIVLSQTCDLSRGREKSRKFCCVRFGVSRN